MVPGSRHRGYAPEARPQAAPGHEISRRASCGDLGSGLRGIRQFLRPDVRMAGMQELPDHGDRVVINLLHGPVSGPS